MGWIYMLQENVWQKSHKRQGGQYAVVSFLHSKERDKLLFEGVKDAL